MTFLQLAMTVVLHAEIWRAGRFAEF